MTADKEHVDISPDKAGDEGSEKTGSVTIPIPPGNSIDPVELENKLDEFEFWIASKKASQR